MAKIIKTGRICGSVVTLGQPQRELYLDEADAESGAIDLGGLLDSRVAAVCRQLEDHWAQRLQREKEAWQAAADQRLREAEINWEAERQQLHQQRYEEGYRAGSEARDAEVSEAVSRLDGLHQAFKQQRTELLQQAEQLVVQLAVACARRIVGAEVVRDPRVVVRVVRAALQQLSERGELEIKVHPEDLQLVRRFARMWVEKVDQDAVLKVTASAHVERGGCLLEGQEENLDARLEEQLRVLQQALQSAASK